MELLSMPVIMCGGAGTRVWPESHEEVSSHQLWLYPPWRAHSRHGGAEDRSLCREAGRRSRAQQQRGRQSQEAGRYAEAGEAPRDRRAPQGLRPWGYYQSVDQGARYQVKRILVRPGGRLSLQKHFHRSEHWIVVKGTAEVTRDGEVIQVHENESISLLADRLRAPPGQSGQN